ncbi:MAG: hypothetical protein ABIF11_06640 [Nitrospirota bacterium]
MPTAIAIRYKLQEVFAEPQATVLSNVIVEAYNDLIKVSDFNELKGIVKEIVEIQKGTDIKMGELAEAQKGTDIKMGELAEAQKGTDIKMGELAEAQKESQKEIGRLDKTMQELAEAQKESQKEIGKLDKTMQELAEAQKRTEIEIRGLTKGLKETRGEVGGLSKSMSYAFENETYRMLPETLKQLCGIEMKERLIRTEIGGKEINILGRAKRDSKDVVVVGEVKLRLDERRESKGKNVFEELDEKVAAVQEEYIEEPVKVLVTHYATKGFVDKAKEKGIIVVQSFEW